MRAYKGFTRQLISRMGNGDMKTCRFVPGETKEVEKSKTGDYGFHCCENPFECLTYYAFDGQNRFWAVEAAGSIDEDDIERISCTKITLIEELTPLKFALEGMKYMITHPAREKWEQKHDSVGVCRDRADAYGKNHIAIARGETPVVSGVEGSILGLIAENEGVITGARLFVVTPEQTGRKYTLSTDGKLEEVEDEKEADRAGRTA